MQIEELDTPAIIVDLELMQTNIATLVKRAKQARVSIRAHLKTAKSIQVAQFMQQNGIEAFCAAKLSEAEIFANAGIDQLLITSEIIGQQKLERLVRLHQQHPGVRVVVDSIAGAIALNHALAGATQPLEVLIELNVGQNRCGVEPGIAVLELAKAIQGLPNLRLVGVQGYEGHLQHTADPATKKELVDAAMQKLSSSVEQLRSNGFRIDIVTTGGTGTWDLCAAHQVVNEVQPGSFIFFDAAYKKALGEEAPYQQALHILTTIISISSGRAVVDAGLKALSNDMGSAILRDFPHITYRPGGDEYGILTWEGATPAGIELGARIAMIPSHIDTTVNLYDNYHTHQSGHIMATWPIQARGKTQ